MNFFRVKSKKVFGRWAKSFGLEPKPFPPRNFALSVKGCGQTYGPFFAFIFRWSVCVSYRTRWDADRACFWCLVWAWWSFLFSVNFDSVEEKKSNIRITELATFTDILLQTINHYRLLWKSDSKIDPWPTGLINHDYNGNKSLVPNKIHPDQGRGGLV